MDKFFSYIEGLNISMKNWLLSFVGIVILRVFLENIISLGDADVFMAHSLTWVHMMLAWFVMAMAMIIIFKHTANKAVEVVSKVVLFGMFAVVIAPLGNFFFGDARIAMSYIFIDSSVSGLISGLVQFWNVANPMFGITKGMVLEAFIILFFTYKYIRYSNGGYLNSLKGMFLVYVSVFFMLLTPNFIDTNNLMAWINSVRDSVFVKNFFGSTYQFSTLVSEFSLYFDGVLAQLWYLFSVLGILLVAWQWQADKVWAIIKNSRPERVLHYFSMIVIGILLAYQAGDDLVLHGWLDWMSITILFVSFYFTWMYSVGINDIADYQTDIITNTERPLVKSVITEAEAKDGNILFLLIALVGGYLSGYVTFLMVISCLGLSYIYSCEPLRLKRCALVGPFLIALGSLAAAMSGFYLFHNDFFANSFPATWSVGIIFVITLFFNVKDIKDYEGDKVCGVYTIPVLFGEEKGKFVIWFLVTISVLVVTILAGDWLYAVPAVPTVWLMWFLIHRQPFVDSYVFRLYLIYLLSIGILFFL